MPIFPALVIRIRSSNEEIPSYILNCKLYPVPPSSICVFPFPHRIYCDAVIFTVPFIFTVAPTSEVVPIKTFPPEVMRILSLPLVPNARGLVVLPKLIYDPCVIEAPGAAFFIVKSLFDSKDHGPDCVSKYTEASLFDESGLFICTELPTLLTYKFPLTWSLAVGDVVPIPTLPDAVARYADCVTLAVPATCKRSPVFVVVPNSVFAAK